MTDDEMRRFIENVRDGKNLSSKDRAEKIRKFNDDIKQQAQAYEKRFKIKPIASDAKSVRERGKKAVSNSRRYAALGLVGTVIGLLGSERALSAMSASPHFRGAYEEAQRGNLVGVERHLIGDTTSDFPQGNHLFGDMVRASDDPKVVYLSLGAYDIFSKLVQAYLQKKPDMIKSLPD
jgi:hypothetical protein